MILKAIVYSVFLFIKHTLKCFKQLIIEAQTRRSQCRPPLFGIQKYNEKKIS